MNADVLLETERLVLRRFTEADVDNLVELDSDPEVMRLLANGRPTPRETVQRVIMPRMLGFGYWAAITKPAGEFAGWFILRPLPGDGVLNLGYRLRRAMWGRDYATEGCTALLSKGFADFGALRVTATTMTVNVRSRRVMEKLGMTLVRTYFTEWPEYIDGAEQGDVEYALLKEDWQPTAVPQD